MPVQTYRYQFEPKGSQHTCPQCGRKREFTRYTDTRNGDLLPDEFGKCNRADQCGYHLNPYHKTDSGLSYADAQNGLVAIPREWFSKAANWRNNGEGRANLLLKLQTDLGATAEQAERVVNFLLTRSEPTRPMAPEPKPLVPIPDELFVKSLGHYEQNQFARLLRSHFGLGVANELLCRFQIGTSARWPGACVFWYIDEQGCKRGGQIKLFDADWHTAKYIDREGQTRSTTDWVHTTLKRQLEKAGKPLPDWLVAYINQRDFSPCMFGLPQLKTDPPDKPVAVVEAPKTAVICTAYFPQFIWLAVGSLSYLNANRMAALRNRRIQLYPDLSEMGQAFATWKSKAEELHQQGFIINVSDYLELNATDEQRKHGLDLADFLLDQWAGYPVNWD